MTLPAGASAPGLDNCLAHLHRDEPHVLVTLVRCAGSTPRNAGARMWVGSQDVVDTLGGGHLEWKAIAQARDMLSRGGPRRMLQRLALGPSLGQCCGGVAWLLFERLDARDRVWLTSLQTSQQQGRAVRRTVDLHDVDQMPLLVAGMPDDGGGAAGLQLDEDAGVVHDVWPVVHATVIICGAGHIGRALVPLLLPLPLRLIWLDPREDIWPAALPESVLRVQDDDGAVAGLPQQAYWLVMTHDHGLDFAIIDAVMRHQDFAFLGLVGSQTKRARFVSRLRRRHAPEKLEHLRCPVGPVFPGIKLPAAIAVAIAAQLLDQLAQDGVSMA